MPILSTITVISGVYPDITVYPNKKKNLFILIGIFYTLGEPISPHLLRCGPFAVEDHSRGQALSS